MVNKADREAEYEWADWLKLMNYFEYESTEGKISAATYEALINALMTFKPFVEIGYKK